MSGIAFSTNVPHTVRGGPPHDLSTPQMVAQHPELYGLTVAARGGTTETKTCTDCHLVETKRQQRDHGAAADAGHQLRQLHRPLLLGRLR